jgi:hypothetical protein
MIAWLKPTRPRTRNKHAFRYRPLLERLERRDTPTSPKLTFAASILSGENVSLTGQVTCDGNPAAAQVAFSGVVSGSTFAHADGSFAVTETASALGIIDAQVTDGAGQQSVVDEATITSAPPSVTLTRTYDNDGSITLSGQVTDQDQAGRTVTFKGAVNNIATTDANGNYTLTTSKWIPGTVLAHTTDVWGQTSNAPSATITNTPSLTFNATIVSGNVVSLTGRVTCDGDPTAGSVDFGGIVSAWASVNADGSYSAVAMPSTLGTITAQVTDGTGHESTVQQATITDSPPTIGLVRTYGPNGSVTLSGHVTDDAPNNLTVNFSGAVTGSATTNANGDFTLTPSSWTTGTVSVRTTDVWGQVSSTATAALGNVAPTIDHFAAVHSAGNLWTFQGEVTDEYAPGLTVHLSGIPTLNGTVGYTATTVGNNTCWFSYSVNLQPGESGTVTAETWDWFGLASNCPTDVVYNPATPTS